MTRGVTVVEGLVEARQRGAVVRVLLDPNKDSFGHDAFDLSPIALITSPVKGCGKSTLLDVMEALCPRPMLGANSSPAALYRSTSKKPTILVDEADLVLSEDKDLVAFFNAGHRGCPVHRCEGEDNHVVEFDSWAAKVMA